MTEVAVASFLLATTKKSTGSSYFLIVILLIVVAGYFLFLRPQQQKAKKQRETNSSVEVGDEILTVGGVVGRIIDMEGDRVTIVTGTDDGASDGGYDEGRPTRIVFVRNAIARKVEPKVAPETEAVASGEEPSTDPRPSWEDTAFGGPGATTDEDDEGTGTSPQKGDGGKK